MAVDTPEQDIKEQSWSPPHENTMNYGHPWQMSVLYGPRVLTRIIIILALNDCLIALLMNVGIVTNLLLIILMYLNEGGGYA